MVTVSAGSMVAVSVIGKRNKGNNLTGSSLHRDRATPRHPKPASDRAPVVPTMPVPSAMHTGSLSRENVLSCPFSSAIGCARRFADASLLSTDDHWMRLDCAGAEVSLSDQVKFSFARASERSLVVQMSDGRRKRSEHRHRQSAGRLQFRRRVRLPRSESPRKKSRGWLL